MTALSFRPVSPDFLERNTIMVGIEAWCTRKSFLTEYSRLWKRVFKEYSAFALDYHYFQYRTGGEGIGWLLSLLNGQSAAPDLQGRGFDSQLGPRSFIFRIWIGGIVQTSNFSCAESNVNEQNPFFKLICIWFGSWKVRRLNCALIYKIVVTTITARPMTWILTKIWWRP